MYRWLHLARSFLPRISLILFLHIFSDCPPPLLSFEYIVVYSCKITIVITLVQLCQYFQLFDMSQLFQETYERQSLASDPKLEIHKKQRAVSRWYDLNPSSTALDVYQPEWTERFSQWYRLASTVDHVTGVSEAVTRGSLNKLDWADFISDDPRVAVAAVALWKLLQKSYKLDVVICNRSKGSAQAIQGWQRLKPFEYLGSGTVQAQWKVSLENLRAEFEAYQDEETVLHRMCEIREAVDALEEAWNELEISWASNLNWDSSKELMLAQIRQAVKWRFSKLNSAMKDDPINIEEPDSVISPMKPKKKRCPGSFKGGDKKRLRL